jgi:hypothetical protein
MEVRGRGTTLGSNFVPANFGSESNRLVAPNLGLVVQEAKYLLQ